jgi:hypothetical protein
MILKDPAVKYPALNAFSSILQSPRNKDPPLKLEYFKMGFGSSNGTNRSGFSLDSSSETG